jgi:hypothetical protein
MTVWPALATTARLLQSLARWHRPRARHLQRLTRGVITVAHQREQQMFSADVLVP